jgi:hypothetical protein
MKGLKGLLVSFVLALSIFPALAFSRDDPVQGRDKQTILDIENEWLRALVEHDRATLDKILADDFLDSSWKAELRTKDQLLKGWQQNVHIHSISRTSKFSSMGRRRSPGG